VPIHADGVEQRIGNTQVELLIEARLHQLETSFYIVPAARIRYISLQTVIRQRALLGESSRRIVERVCARVVVDAVSTDKRTDRQQRVGAKRMLVARRDLTRDCLLALSLPELVIIVGNLNTVSSGERVSLERV